MKLTHLTLIWIPLLSGLVGSAHAQHKEIPRPPEWKNLALGGRFMDRFEPMPLLGERTADTWGVEEVKPRDVRNGIEDAEWSYWGSNILEDENGLFHFFVCRWREDHPKGHMAWHESEVETTESTELKFALLTAANGKHFTPDQCLAEQSIHLEAGVRKISVSFPVSIQRAGYHFIKLAQNAKVRVRESEQRLTGVLSASAEFNKKVATSSLQEPPEDIGIDAFEFWLPQRRPAGRNLAMTIEPPLDADGNILAKVEDHHGARYECRLPDAIRTTGLRLKIKSTHGAPASVFRLRVFGTYSISSAWDRSL